MQDKFQLEEILRVIVPLQENITCSEIVTLWFAMTANIMEFSTDVRLRWNWNW